MNDDRVGELLHDAVADVEPADRLAEIRARTASPARAAARPWFYAAGATALATAAAVTAFAVLGNDDTRDAGPADHGQHGDDRATTQVPAYYVGETPQGPRLYREFDLVAADDVFEAALVVLQRDPVDPDYATLWQPNSFADASYERDVITVELADDTLRDRPDGMDERDAELAVQQVIYTLQGSVQDQAPVQFVLDGNPVDQVYGVHTAEPLVRAPQVEVVSLVLINDPVERLEVSGSFTAHGAASSYEATVPWQILDGDTVVKEGYATAEGWMDKLYPWEAEVDVSDLEPGEYTFVAMTDDPSGGAEGFGPFTDTRTIVVR